jgi:hypothetical protein
MILASLLPAAAQPSITRQIVPVPYNDGAPVAVSVSMDQKEPRISSTVAICFQASRAGFATLWNISTRGEVSRIFPNSFLPGTGASHVDAGRRYCAGVSGDPFRFRVDGPPGTEDLYLLWTARPDLQPQAVSYADAAALVTGMQKLGGANTGDWATSKLTYDIVPATGPVPPPLPPQQVNGATTPAAPVAAPTAPRPKVFVLAMGANVEKLTKTNQDAGVFSQTVSALFNVEPDNTRLIANATHADFFHGMQWLADHAGPQDFIFIYFSGHGGRFQSKSSDDGWDEFLVPYDFNTPGADVKNLVFSQQFASWINELPSKNVVAVIDACHSAGVFRSIEADTLGARNKFMIFPASDNPALITAGMRPATRAAGGANRVKANGILLAASHRDQSALEGANGGFFTLALTQEMMSKSGGTLADVFARSVDDTLQMSHNRQAPEAVGDLDMARHIKFNP